MNITRSILLTYLFTLMFFTCFGQLRENSSKSFYEEKFVETHYTFKGSPYTLYDFSRQQGTIKAKYFAVDAYNQLIKWKGDKQILLVTAGAFSDSFDYDGKPVGLCVDNGAIVNRSIDQTMDGMVVVYNGSAQVGGIVVVDLDISKIRVETEYGKGSYATYDPRNSPTDRYHFLKWGEHNMLTLFQTQLLYSSDKASNYNLNHSLNYGAERERRFLAICRKGGVVHHVVVDAPEMAKLNQAARNTLQLLNQKGFSVLYILNLDTGGKNVLYTYNGRYLEDHRPNHNKEARIEKATNLLVYYID